jgi:hypothetical protein
VTEKQNERLLKKIADVKRALAAERRKFGCYDDSRGIRYLPTKYYIQLKDFSGGLKYLRWFEKNFPDDTGFPEFLFEWTILLFKAGKTKDAGEKAFQTFCSNIYWFDKFFRNPIVEVDIWHSSSSEMPSHTDYLEYVHNMHALEDFSLWLESFISSKDFFNRSNKYIEIYRRLKTEKDNEMRHYLLEQAQQLESGLES